MLLKKNRMLLKALATLLMSTVFLWSSLSEAQNSVEVKEKAEPKEEKHSFLYPKMATLYFSPGISFYDVGGLNNRLEAAGYSKMDSPSLNLGLGLDVRIGRLIVGGEGHWFMGFGSESDRADLRTDISGGYGLFRLGVDAIQWKGLSVYPILGIGSGRTTIRIANELGANFNDVLVDPGREVTMNQRALLLDASLGVDYRFKIRKTDYKTSFFTLGVRGGYMFQPHTGDWKTGGAEIANGPDVGLNGPTVQLLIGITGQRHKYRSHHKK